MEWDVTMKAIGTKLISGVALALALASAPAQAATVFFGENQSPGFGVSGDPVTARNSFLSNLSGVGTENFESQPYGQTPPIVLTFPGSSGSITATLSGSNVSIGNTATGSGVGRYATSGSQYLETSSSGFTITFSTAIAAFGFYATDVGDFNGQLTVTTANGTSHQYTVANTVGGNDGSLLFWGIIDTVDLFTSITFGNTAAGTDFFGFDDMTIGDVNQVVQPGNEVPLPGALPLFVSGLGALGFVAHRRKRKQAA